MSPVAPSRRQRRPVAQDHLCDSHQRYTVSRSRGIVLTRLWITHADVSCARKYRVPGTCRAISSDLSSASRYCYLLCSTALCTASAPMPMPMPRSESPSLQSRVPRITSKVPCFTKTPARDRAKVFAWTKIKKLKTKKPYYCVRTLQAYHVGFRRILCT